MIRYTLALFLLFPAALQAADFTFTAIERRWAEGSQPNIGSFHAESTATLTVSTNSDTAEITLPPNIFSAHHAWPPVAAVLFNTAEARNGDCDAVEFFYGDVENSQQYCLGLLRSARLADGRHRIEVPKAWFLNAALYPYEIQKRYDTCQQTDGAVDTRYPNRPCPAAGSGHGTANYVGRPWIAWMMTIQEAGSHHGREFMFLGDTEGIRRLAGPPGNSKPEWQPAPEHYGELEKIYAWIENPDESTDEPTEEAPRVSQILTHVFSGSLASSTAETEITITNRTQQPCKVRVLFHQGTAEAPRVRFNGRRLDNNTLEATIPGGTAHKLTMTRDAGQDLAAGAVYVAQQTECPADALQVEGRYLITNPRRPDHGSVFRPSADG